ncbi:hypothetical protein LXA62_18270, partial [Erwinia amylovora]|uniref:hypothetical protein n=1 Tax=Erwinia amylovora TaxID=552 RepID=UPI0020BEDD69
MAKHHDDNNEDQNNFTKAFFVLGLYLLVLNVFFLHFSMLFLSQFVGEISIVSRCFLFFFVFIVFFALGFCGAMVLRTQ